MSKNTKHLNILGWLKKIFTTQKKIAILTLLGTIATFVSVWIGYKAYKDSLPSQISLLYRNHYRGHLKNVDDIVVFHSLLIPFRDGLVQFGLDNEGGSYGMPMMANNTKKSITNLELKVFVHFPMLKIDRKDICPDYEILRFEPENYYMELKYKPNILLAWSAIPIPISKMYQTEPNTDDPFVNRTLNIRYSMTYEGAKEPKSFWVLYDVNKDSKVSEEVIRNFLSDVYYEVYKNDNSLYKSDQWLISIIYNYDYNVFDWPRHGNKNMFDRSKKKYINRNRASFL